MDRMIFGVERKQSNARAKFLEDIAAGRQGVGCEVVPGLCRERMLAVGTANTVRRPQDHRRALIMRLVGFRPGAAASVFRPGLLEFLPLAVRVMAVEERLIPLDAGGDEIFGGLFENGAP